MIIGLTNLSFKNQNFEKFTNHIKKLKFQYIEVAPFILDKNPFVAKNYNKYKKILIKKKIKIVSIQSIFFPHKKKLKQKKLTIYLSEVFRFAKKLNIKNISIGNTPYRKDNGKNIENINLNFFKTIIFFAKKYRIKVSIEPISKKYGNSFLKDHDEVLKFLNKIKSPWLKILFDFGNFYENSNPSQIKKFLKKNIKKINHVHLSNKNIKKYDLKYIKKNLKILSELKYKNPIIIETLDSDGKKILNYGKL